MVHILGRQRTNSSQLFLVVSGCARNPPNSVQVADRPGLTLQYTPYPNGGSYLVPGSFSIMSFAASDLPDVVYLEQLTSALYLDRRADVDSYHAVMERLCLQAAPATDMVRILNEIRAGL